MGSPEDLGTGDILQFNLTSCVAKQDILEPLSHVVYRLGLVSWIFPPQNGPGAVAHSELPRSFPPSWLPRNHSPDSHICYLAQMRVKHQVPHHKPCKTDRSGGRNIIVID